MIRCLGFRRAGALDDDAGTLRCIGCNSEACFKLYPLSSDPMAKVCGSRSSESARTNSDCTILGPVLLRASPAITGSAHTFMSSGLVFKALAAAAGALALTADVAARSASARRFASMRRRTRPAAPMGSSTAASAIYPIGLIPVRSGGLASAPRLLLVDVEHSWTELKGAQTRVPFWSNTSGGEGACTQSQDFTAGFRPKYV